MKFIFLSVLASFYGPLNWICIFCDYDEDIVSVEKSMNFFGFELIDKGQGTNFEKNGASTESFWDARGHYAYSSFKVYTIVFMQEEEYFEPIWS